MRFSLQLLILLTLPFFTLTAQNITVKSDSCTPSFSTVFNYNTGDVFQYKKTSTSSGGGSSPTYETISQYTIIDKWEDEQSVYYAIHGWTQESFFYNSDNNLSETTDTVTNYNEIYDEISYTDSATHFLNKCPKELVKVDYSRFEEFKISDLYSKVVIAFVDSQMVKTIGGKDNLFALDSSKQLSDISDIYFKAEYQSNLGLTSLEFSFLEIQESIVLEAYIKGNDTVGDIIHNTDFAYQATEATQLTESKKKILYPNPTQGLLKLNNDAVSRIDIYTMNGQLVLTEKIQNATVDISHLPKALYISRLYLLNGKSVTEKLIVN